MLVSRRKQVSFKCWQIVCLFIYSAPPVFEKLSTGKKGIRHANFPPSPEAKECITPSSSFYRSWLYSEGGSHKTQFNMQFSRKVGGEILKMQTVFSVRDLRLSNAMCPQAKCFKYTMATKHLCDVRFAFCIAKLGRAECNHSRKVQLGR